MDFSSSPSSFGGGSLKRAPPPPIRIAQSSYASSNSYHGARRGSAAALLYDLPSASPRKSEYGSSVSRPGQSRILSSPPATDELLYSIPTPGSPPTRLSRTVLTGPRRTHHPQSPPPLPGRPRGSTSLPPAPTQKELEEYEAACRAFFYNQDESAKLSMDAILSRAPQYYQAKYTRLQANIRREYHLTQSLRKISEFRAHLSSIQPGCSLSLAARTSPNGAPARQERAARFRKFVEAQSGSAGTQNFFVGLYTAMRLQTLPPSIGGTGERRIEWEIDDAVFMESGGNQFMLEAVDVMKGVLGFDERPVNYRPLPSRAFRHRPSYSSPTNTVHHFIDRGEDSPLSDAPITRPLRSAPPARSRAGSDPFLDPSRSSPSMNAPLSMTMPTPEESATDLDSLGPSTPPDERDPELPAPPASFMDPHLSSACSMDAEAFLNEPQLRVWTFPPYLTNPELYSLIAMLPSSITSQPVPRFKPATKAKRRDRKLKTADIDLEGEGNPIQMDSGADPANGSLDTIKERGEVRKGTGRMWIGDFVRLPGWRGTFWDSVRDWFRHLFG